jgi:hypothetical protein
MARDEQQLPPFRWGDRYDLAGVGVVLAVGVVLFLIGVSVWLALVFAFAAVNLSAFGLRRWTGVPQATLWQRARRRQRPGRGDARDARDSRGP